MTAIYKKELKSYLTSMIGYLFMAFTLALFGLYFTAINLQQGYPEIGYALQNSAFILLIAVPVLTMRVLSEEQKNKTDQLLFIRCRLQRQILSLENIWHFSPFM